MSATQIAPTFEASLNVDTRNVPLGLQQQQPRQFPHSMGGPQTMMFPNATQQQFMQSQHSIQSVQQQQSAARAQGMGPLAGSRGPMGPSPAGAQSNQAQSLTNGPAQFNSMEPRDMANLMMQNSGGSMTMPMSGLPSQAPFPSALVAQSQGPIQGPAMQRRMAVNPQGTSIGVSHPASQRHTPMNIASQGMGIGMGLGPATSLPTRTQTAAPQQMGQSMRIPQNVQNVPNMQNIQQADLQRMFAQQQQQQGSPALRAQQRPGGQGQQVQAFQQHFAAAEMATQNGLVRPMSTQPTGQRMIPQGQSMPHHPGHMVNSQQFVNVSVSARTPNSSAQHLVPSLNQPPVLAQANPAALQSMQQRTRTPYQAGLSTPSLVHATHHPRPQSSHASPPSRPPSHAGTPVLASASAPNGVPMRAQQSTPEVFPGGSNTIFQNALSHNNGARMPQNDPSPTQYRFDRPSTTGPSGVQTHLQSPSQQHQAVARGQQPAFLPTPAQSLGEMESAPSVSTGPINPALNQTMALSSMDVARSQSVPSMQQHGVPPHMQHAQLTPGARNSPGPSAPPPLAGPSKTPRQPSHALPSPHHRSVSGSQPPQSAPQTPRTPAAYAVHPAQQQQATRPPNPMTAVPAPNAVAGPSMQYRQPIPLGQGQGILLLLTFAGSLVFTTPERHQLNYWDNVVNKYFHPEGFMKFTLWKDNIRLEAKPFDIGLKILPRFFLVTGQSGVQSMSLSLDLPDERYIPANGDEPPQAEISCKNATWTYKYYTGYTVALRGPLSATIYYDTTSSKPRPLIKLLSFDANSYDKQISVSAIRSDAKPIPSQRQGEPSGQHDGTPEDRSQTPNNSNKNAVEDQCIHIEKATLPPEPVNAFGIPQVTMRCLELAESCESMGDLMDFALSRNLGPSDALKQLVAHIRNTEPSSYADFLSRRSTNMGPTTGSAHSHYPNPIAPSPSGTLQNHAGASPSQMSSPSKNHPPALVPATGIPALVDSATGRPAPSGGPPSATPSNSTPTATPIPAPASLKRKNQNESQSESAPPAKRATTRRKPKNG